MKYKAVPNVGDTFFDLHARQVDGRPFDRSQIGGKVVVLFFWYSGCGPCHRAIEPLREVYEKYKAQGMEVLTFSFDEKEADWLRAMQTYHPPGIGLADLVGFSSPTFLHYAVNAFPEFIVFGRDQKVALITGGADEVPLVERKVKELLTMLPPLELKMNEMKK